MSELDDKIRRLGERGPHADPESVITAAIDRANADPDGRLDDPQGRRPWFLAVAAACVAVVIGVGVALATSGSDEQGIDTVDRPTETVPDSTTEPPTTATTSPPQPTTTEPPETATLDDWVGVYEWVEFVEGDPGSDQTLVHTVALFPSGNRLHGTFRSFGFQTDVAAPVVATAAKDGIAVRVSETTDRYEEDDTLFVLSGSRDQPTTTLGAIETLRLEQPSTGDYFQLRPATILSLTGDGLLVSDVATGTSITLPFGHRAEDVIATVEARFGVGLHRDVDSDCVEFMVEWPAVTVLFADETFVGWELSRPTTLSTPFGINVGTTRSELDATGQVYRIGRTPSGLQFTLDDDDGITGLLSGPDPDDRVTWLSASDGCTAG